MTIRIRPGTRSRRLIDGLVVVPPDGEPVIVSPPGDAVWALLVAGADRGRLLDELNRRFDGAGDRIATDVETLLARLAEIGAVEELAEP